MDWLDYSEDVQDFLSCFILWSPPPPLPPSTHWSTREILNSCPIFPAKSTEPNLFYSKIVLFVGGIDVWQE